MKNSGGIGIPPAQPEDRPCPGGRHRCPRPHTRRGPWQGPRATLFRGPVTLCVRWSHSAGRGWRKGVRTSTRESRVAALPRPVRWRARRLTVLGAPAHPTFRLTGEAARIIHWERRSRGCERIALRGVLCPEGPGGAVFLRQRVPEEVEPGSARGPSLKEVHGHARLPDLPEPFFCIRALRPAPGSGEQEVEG